MVIPIIAAFAAGAAGVAAAAAATTLVGTIAAYATIAGAVLTGVGAISGSKDLMKVGAILSIGGGLVGLAAGAASGTAAVSGMDLAADAGATGANSVGGAAAAADAGASGGTAAGIDAGVEAGMAPPQQVLAANQAPAVVNPTTGMPVVGNNLTSLNSNTAAGLDADVTAGLDGTSLSQQAANGAGSGNVASVTAPDPSAITPSSIDPAGATPSTPGTPTTQAPSTPALDKLAKAASQTTSSDMASWFDKMRNVGGAVGDFMQKNPQLVKIGGDMLSSMYGPQAEKFDYEKSLMERARRNMNTPVVMTYNRGGQR